MSENTKPTTDALTAILHKRAEAKLRAKIEAMLPNPCDVRESVKLSAETMSNLSNLTNSQGKCWVPYLLEAALEGLFAAQVEDARAKEVTEFLAKVENTAAELEAIREELHQ